MPCFNAAVGAEGRVGVMLEQPAHPTVPTASEEEDQPSRLAANAIHAIIASMMIRTWDGATHGGIAQVWYAYA